MSKVVTPNAVLSYPHFAAPQKPKNPSQKAKHSGTFVFAPGTDLSALRKAVEEVAIERFGAKAPEMMKKGSLRSPFRTDAEAKGYAEGSIFINTRSEQKPGLVYLYPEPGTTKPMKVADEDITKVFYPGAIVRANITAFAYDTDGNKGVSFALNHVQKIAEGERLDSRQDAQDAFEADLNAAPAELKDLM